MTFDTIAAFRLEHRALGPETVTWVDDRGTLVEETVRGGYRLRRSAFEIVNADYRQARRAENSGWRRLIPGMVELATRPAPPRREPPAPGHLTIEEQGQRTSLPNPLLPVSPDSLDRTTPWHGPFWDQAGPDDSALVAQTAQALAGAATARDSAAALARWVGRRIRLDPGGFATASRTLAAGRGTADGMVRLFVSMARLAGIPARVIRGVVLVPEGALAHSWAEVWIGQWVAADPAFGQFPAEGARVGVGVGERSRPVDLVPILASARFLPITPPR